MMFSWLKYYIQFSSVTQSCLTFCDPMDCSMPGFPVHHQLPQFAQTHVHQVSDAIQASHPPLSPFPPDFNLSQHQGLFKWGSSLHHLPKYWSFSFSINLSNEYSGLISFRMDWLDHLAVHCMYIQSANTISKMSLLYWASTKDTRNIWILENLLFNYSTLSSLTLIHR